MTTATPADRTYDAIVIGGGHNGLVNGAYLAKAGLRTLILERRHLVGGAAITEELHPGFWFTTFSYALSLLRPQIVQDLELVKHGFMPLLMSSTFAPGEDGDYLWLTKDHDQNVREIARHSRHDADAYTQYSARPRHGVSGAQAAASTRRRPTSSATTPRKCWRWRDLGRRVRGMDKRTLHNAVRLLTGSAADFLDDYFESELLKGYLASSSIIGTKVGPRSQGSGLVLLYHSLGEHDGEFGSWAFHKHGNGGFTQVLARAAESFGAEIRLEAPVQGVLTERRQDHRRRPRRRDRAQRARRRERPGPAPHVPRARRPARTPRRPRRERAADALPGHVVQGQLRPRRTAPSSPGCPAAKTSSAASPTSVPRMDYLEHAFDEAKYGWYSSRPYIDGAVQSTVDPDMAPPGKHVMSCFIQYTPYRLRESDWDTERQRLGDTVQRTLESFFPGFGDLVLHREVVTPLDIERTVGLSEGNIFAGEFFAPQMFFFRPAPGWSQYRTPVEGYYQCGSGTHPGGCVMGAPGMLAARRILADRAR